MDAWLIALLSVLEVVFLLIALPVLTGLIYRCRAKKISGATRLDGKTVIVTGSSSGEWLKRLLCNLDRFDPHTKPPNCEKQITKPNLL